MTPRAARFRWSAALVGSVLGLWMVGWQINSVWGPGPAHSLVFEKFGFIGALTVSALLCVAGGFLRRTERAAWILIGAGCLVWIAGDVYYQLVLATKAQVPFPSAADIGYLGFYPPAFAGVVLLFRTRSGRASPAQWLDGITAALAMAALSASVGLDAVLGTIGGDPLQVAVLLAYPLGDLILVAVVVGGLVVCGQRSARAWAWVGVGFAMFCIADALYLVQVSGGTYHVGSWYDVGWPAAMACLAAGAWSPTPRRAPRSVRPHGLGQVAVPMAFAVMSIALLLYTGSEHLNWASRILAAASLAVVLLRLARTFHDYTDVMAERERDAGTDALTGLANRRALNADLAAIARRSARQTTTLATFDLDGFKHYNDTFGHHAGDALLARMGAKLRDGVGAQGRAYRMGGDEFCVIVADAWEAHAGDIVQRSVDALIEVGDGFAVRCSHGVVRFPDEAAGAEAAMQLADQRMYACKGSRRTSAREQSRDVLLAALREHAPDLGDQTDGVRELAEAVGRGLGLEAAELELVCSTAVLHDIGKMAIPRAILDKPAPLTHEEWTFMRRHPAIGDRIVSAAPALTDVGAAVRATHERWDGKGYPDRVAGLAIPLPARIVGVCVALDAMTAERPFAARRTVGEAIAELHRGAGSQFDPMVVAAVAAEIAERAAAPELVAVG